MSGVVDEDVDAAQFSHRLVDDLAAMLGILDVAGYQHGLAASSLDQAFGVLGILVLFKIRDENVRPFPRIGNGDGAADAAIAAGDDRLLVLEPV